jgi:hypothetical protein
MSSETKRSRFEQAVAGWSEKRRHEAEERAAILEYDAGLNRIEAEHRAYAEVRDEIHKAQAQRMEER